MKVSKTLAIVALLCVVSAASFMCGKSSNVSELNDLQSKYNDAIKVSEFCKDSLRATKDYQVACILSDCCRNMVDNIGLEAEEIYHEYIDNLDCDSVLVITKEDIDNYYWCY